MGIATIIEQRWCDRHDVTLYVDVVDQNGRSQKAVSKDLGIGGACLYLQDDEQQYPESSDVYLDFYVVNQQDVSKYRLCGKVGRQSGKELAVTFPQLDSTDFQVLRKIVEIDEVQSTGAH